MGNNKSLSGMNQVSEEVWEEMIRGIFWNLGEGEFDFNSLDGYKVDDSAIHFDNNRQVVIGGKRYSSRVVKAAVMAYIDFLMRGDDVLDDAFIADIKTNPNIMKLIEMGAIKRDEIKKALSYKKTVEDLYSSSNNIAYIHYLKETGQVKRIDKLITDGLISVEQIKKIYGEEGANQEVNKFNKVFENGLIDVATAMNLAKTGFLQVDKVLELICQGNGMDIAIMNDDFVKLLTEAQRAELDGNIIKAVKGDRINSETTRKLIEAGSIKISEINFSEEELVRLYNNTPNGFLKYASRMQILIAYAKGADISNNFIRKNGEEYRGHAIQGYSEGDINKSAWMELIRKLPKSARPSSEEIFGLFESNVAMANAGGTNKQTINGVDVLELVKNGFIDEKRLIDVYEYYSEMSSYVVFPEVWEGRAISNSEYIKYFSVDKIIKMIEQEDIRDRFITMYKELNPSTEQMKAMIGEYEKNNQNVNGEIIKLLDNGLIGIDIALPYMSDEQKDDYFISRLENGDVDIEVALQYVTSGKIEEMYYDNKISLEGIAQAYANGFIDKEKFDKIIKQEELCEYLKSQDVQMTTFLQMYVGEKADIDYIMTVLGNDKELLTNFRKVVKEEVITSTEEEKRKAELKRLEELVVCKLVDYDTLQEMESEGVIEAEEFKNILEAYRVREEIEKIKQTNELINCGVSERWISPY